TSPVVICFRNLRDLLTGLINDIEFSAGNWPPDPNYSTIIFLHGSGGTNILWQYQVKALSEKMNAIAINLPGHGNSAGPGMDRIADYAKSVSTFNKSINVRHPVICGLSIGGAIVLQLLIDEQENFKGGIIVNSGAKLKVMPLIFEIIEKDYLGFINLIYKFGVSQKTDPAKLKSLVESMALCSAEVTRGDFNACNTFNVMEQLNKINTPVLVITASDDQLTPIKYGQFLAEHIQNATIANIEDAGHLSPVERPEEVTRIIHDFTATI
ncbi:alpha/beta fold hydrolase, partial [candidate division CSSED10-310 bacterium]